MERSVVLIKPDGIKRGLAGEIISRFEKAGLKIVAMKMVWIDKKFALKHYGYTDEWFENVGKRTKEFYQAQGYDPGEEISKMANKEIGKLVQQWNVDYLTEGPVLAMILEGPEVVKIVRKMVGPTYPQDAPPGTIRGDYSFDSPLWSNQRRRSVYNLIHASGKPEEAELEIQLWFKEGEIHKYQRVEELLMVGKE
ncbi:MAG TPA: nucleoside-diphosphate kinase [Patescibacteria group bacterium]|nr:nucleoside-diphosphate kinase [Patescibacteria group bacterium]